MTFVMVSKNVFDNQLDGLIWYFMYHATADCSKEKNEKDKTDSARLFVSKRRSNNQ